MAHSPTARRNLIPRSLPNPPPVYSLMMTTSLGWMPTHRAIDDALFTRLRAQFDDDEILDLTLCLAVYLGLGRTLEVLQVDEACAVDL